MAATHSTRSAVALGVFAFFGSPVAAAGAGVAAVLVAVNAGPGDLLPLGASMVIAALSVIGVWLVVVFAVGRLLSLTRRALGGILVTAGMWTVACRALLVVVAYNASFQ